MAVMTVTDINIGDLVVGLDVPEFSDELVTFAGTATYLRGTILARDSVSLKLVPFVKGGVTNGNGVAKAVLAHTINRTGAGDVKARALFKCTVAKSKLIIAADGSAVNVDGAVVDGLRDYGINVVEVQSLAGFDTHD